MPADSPGGAIVAYTPRAVPAPRRTVEGCSCGGLTAHAAACTLLDLDPEEAAARIAAAGVRTVAEQLADLVATW